MAKKTAGATKRVPELKPDSAEPRKKKKKAKKAAKKR
jgi:hypothetical protein